MNQPNSIQRSIESLEAAVLTDEERYEASDYDDISDVAGPSSSQAQALGAGYLHLGDCDRAKSWFEDSAETWAWNFDTSVELSIDNDETIVGSTWQYAQKALESALLSGSKATLEGTVNKIADIYTTIPEDRKGPEDLATMVETLTVLSAGAVEVDTGAFPTAAALAERLQQIQIPSRSAPVPTTYYEGFAKATEGFYNKEKAEIEAALLELHHYHETSIQQGRYDAIQEEAEITLKELFAIESTILIVLARLHGFDVRVDSEYVPDLIFDEDCYPICDGS